MRLRSFVLCSALALATSMASCSDARQDGSADPSAGVEGSELTTATPRGLAAGIIAHLAGIEVSSVSGTDEGGAISVMVGTTDPEIETVHLYVQVAPDIGPLPCGTDSGYESTSCKASDASTAEVLSRKNSNDNMPYIMGRFYDAERKSVLVQVWGSPGAHAEALIRELLNDPLLGAVTTTALNNEGKQLSDFEALQTEIRSSDD